MYAIARSVRIEYQNTNKIQTLKERTCKFGQSCSIFILQDCPDVGE